MMGLRARAPVQCSLTALWLALGRKIQPACLCIRSALELSAIALASAAWRYLALYFAGLAPSLPTRASV